VKTRPGDYVHALVTRALPLEIHARIGPPGQENAEIILLPDDWRWTGLRYGDALVKPGDVIYVHLAETMEGVAHRATLEQDSGAQGSLLAIDNTNGDVLAMIGGRDYALSQFNRATQSERQTGSSFQALRLHRGRRRRCKTHRHHRRRPGQIRQLHSAQL